MSAAKVMDIWPIETGIRDFEVKPATLAVAESARIRQEWANRRAELGDSERLRLFSEQLSREWSIETGIIENLYYIDRGVTITLIERGFQEALLQHGSADKDPKYIIALLEDQQRALENLFAFVRQDRALTAGYIKELHAMMTQSQTTTEAFSPSGDLLQVPLIHGDWKKEPNYPFRDGVQFRYCPPEQTASEMDRLVDIHERHSEAGVPPEVEAAWLHHRFTQIHPFQDGNGRVARALSSLVLIRAGMFPLIVPREEKSIYLQALERADGGILASLATLISRRQEVSFQKASDLLLKLAPEPETMDEAASRLGKLYSRRNAVVAGRLEKRIGELHSWVYNELQSQARKAATAMRKAAGIEEQQGGGGFGGGFSSPSPGPTVEVFGANAKDQFLDMARRLMLERWNVIAGRPCDAFVIKFQIDATFDAVVHIHALNPESDESLQVAGFLTTPGEAALELEPLTWGPNEGAGEFQQRVAPWTEQFFRRAMAAIARHT